MQLAGHFRTASTPFSLHALDEALQGHQCKLSAPQQPAGAAWAGGGCLRLMQHDAALAVLLNEALELALWRQPSRAQVHT